MKFNVGDRVKWIDVTRAGSFGELGTVIRSNWGEVCVDWDNKYHNNPNWWSDGHFEHAREPKTPFEREVFAYIDQELGR